MDLGISGDGAKWQQFLFSLEEKFASTHLAICSFGPPFKPLALDVLRLVVLHSVVDRRPVYSTLPSHLLSFPLLSGEPD